MKVLVTGVTGQVGGELMQMGSPGCTLIPADRSVLDLSNSASIRNGFQTIAPDVVVNCAAYTKVDQAESEKDLAFAVNAKAPELLAESCHAADIPLIQISTDYVFNGQKSTPYLPDDPVDPLGVYGTSKEAGEAAIRKAHQKHIIIRTAWVFSELGANFVKTMLRVGENNDQLRVVADQHGCPTSARDIAMAITHALRAIMDGKEPWGTYHFCNSGVTNWHGFAEEIFNTAQAEWGRKPDVAAITTEEYPTPAARPEYSVLDTSSFTDAFGYQPRPWQDAVQEVVINLLKK